MSLLSLILIFFTLKTEGIERPEYNALLKESCHELSCKDCTGTNRNLIYKALLTSCELLKESYGCNKLEEAALKLDASSKEKFLSCTKESACQNQSSGIGCSLGIYNAGIDLITSPVMITKALLGTFQKDEACFHNKDGIKEKLINSFDLLIVPELVKHQVPMEVKAKMVKDWPCHEVRSYLNRRYQKYESELFSLKKTAHKNYEPPIVTILNKSIESIGTRWNCYNERSQAEMLCYLSSSLILPPVMAKGLLGLLAKKYPELPSPPPVYKVHFIRNKKTNMPPTPNEIRTNPQIAIWKYEELGMSKEAEELKHLLAAALTKAEIAGKPQLTGTGVIKAKYVTLSDGTTGVWKPDEVLTINGPIRGLANKEVAAYLIDQKLGLNLVPITVKRELDGKQGSIQLRVNNLDIFKRKEQNLNSKKSEFYEYEPDPDALLFLDDLLANTDRNKKNVLSSGGKAVAIDHNVSLTRDSHGYFRETVNSELQKVSKSPDNSYKEIATLHLKYVIPPKAVVEKLKNTPNSVWEKELTPLIGSEYAQQFITRKNQILDAIDRAEKKLGGEIYPDAPFSPDMRLLD